VLVFLFLRGGVDGLSVIVPHADPAYYADRKRTAIARAELVELDGRFGLPPALRRLEPFWRQKLFAAIQAVGSPDPTRSHFDAQDYMETGTPGRKSTSDGWLGRALALRPDRTLLRAVALAERPPRVLSGPVPAIATKSLAAFEIRPRNERFERALGALYTGQDALERASRETLQAVRRVRAVRRAADARRGARYPAPARALGEIAALIRADVGLEVAVAEIGGWDTHAGQGGAEGQLPRKLELLARGVEAFRRDLGDRFENVLLVCATEFGRTVAENGSGGTDHGHASAMLLFGGALSGGKIYGTWPGLAREQRHQGRDLAVTTDFRDVFAEALVRHLGLPRAASLFPGYAVDPSRFLGFVA
jgi:uncharacterized protein (DUF1501 family)